MSSESQVRILTVENLRVPGEGSSSQGKSGPKARPKGVVDGQLVEIPVLPLFYNRGRDAEREAKHAAGRACPRHKDS